MGRYKILVNLENGKIVWIDARLAAVFGTTRKALEGKADRSARFRTVIALSDPEGNVETVAGACEGSMIEQLRGSNGFGYDPLFVPEGYAETFAELDASVKNRISHRANALKAAQKKWGGLLSSL